LRVTASGDAAGDRITDLFDDHCLGISCVAEEETGCRRIM
jgi:hypothetical protein